MGAVGINSAEDMQDATALQIPMLSMHGGAMALPDNSVDKTSKNYKAGYAAGLEEANARLAQEQQRVSVAGATLEKIIAALELQFQQESAMLLKKVYAATAPALARHSAILELYDVIEKKLVLEGQALSVRIHPEVKAVLEEHAGAGVLEVEKLKIVADEAVSENAYAISWEKGGMNFDADALIAEVLKLLPQANDVDEE